MLTKYNLIATIDKLDYDRDLTTEQKLLMAKSLEKFCIRAINKFIAGQKHHGGDIRNRDLAEEMANEHVDMFWYGVVRDEWPRPKLVTITKKGKEKRIKANKNRCYGEI